MPISKQFDSVFARHAGHIPLPYLRALAWYESGLNPRAVHPKGSATGLFQVTKVALDEFNRRAGTTYSLTDLADPELSTKVAVAHIGNLLDVYGTVAALKPDWQSRRFVELLTLGWNGGHNAVVKVARTLETEGIPPERITVDTTAQLAGKLQVAYLSDPQRVAWAKRVAAAYLTAAGSKAPGSPATASAVPSAPSPGAGAVLVAAAVISAAVVGAYSLAAPGSLRRRAA